jgi:hypothetical protein
MDETADLKPRRSRRVTLIAGLSALAVYVFSIGPAFRVWGPGVLRGAVYRPLMELARFEPLGELEAGYLILWSRGDQVERSADDTPGENGVIYLRNPIPDNRSIKAVGDR